MGFREPQSVLSSPEHGLRLVQVSAYPDAARPPNRRGYGADRQVEDSFIPGGVAPERAVDRRARRRLLVKADQQLASSWVALNDTVLTVQRYRSGGRQVVRVIHQQVAVGPDGAAISLARSTDKTPLEMSLATLSPAS